MTAPHVLHNLTGVVGGIDLSTLLRSAPMQFERETAPGETFGPGANWANPVATKRKASWPLEGYTDDADGVPDTDFFAEITGDGVGIVAHVVERNPVAIGDVGFFGRFTQSRYVPAPGELHALASFTLELMGADEQARGIVLDSAQRTATGQSAGVQHGTVSATQSIYAILQVLAASGTGSPTLDVTIESDDDSGFASPVTRLTFPQVTDTPDHQGLWIAPVAGPITDDWWRVNAALGGTTKDFTYQVMFAIQ